MKKNNIETSNDLIRLKESFNKAFDSKIETKKLQEKVAEFSNLNFGDLKTLFEGISYRLFDNNRDCIADYVKTIKGNKALSTLYNLYENSLKPSHTKDAGLLVFAMTSLSDGIDKKQLNEGISKLTKIVKESVLKSGVSVEEVDELLSKNKSINESLSFIFTNKKSPKNLFEYTNRVHEAVNYINENMTPENVDADTVIKTNGELLKDLNEAISCENEWEREAIKELTLVRLSESTGEELFEQYKQDCLSLLNEKIEESNNMEEGIRFSTMKESLEKKMFDGDKLNESILKLAELKYTLGE